jgi:hypothetical protein
MAEYKINVYENHGLMNNVIHFRMRFGQHERIAGVVTTVVHYTVIFIMSLVFGQRISTDITGTAELFACDMSFFSKSGGSPMIGCHF